MKTRLLVGGVLVLLLLNVEAARILGLFPHPGKSHYDVYQPLMEGLAAKGHNITVVGYFPHTNPPRGYQDISLEGVMKNFTNAVPFSIFENRPSDWLRRPYYELSVLARIGLVECDTVLATPQIQGLLLAKGQYDLDLEDFISGAEDGVIVFSMGSILNAATLDQNKKQAFINAFRALPQRIIWKIDGEFTNLPSNVKTVSWLPQRDVVAHPNVLPLLSHGGLLSVTEAVISGTPIVGIPMTLEENLNVRSGVQRGIIIELNYDELSEHTIQEAVKTVLSEKYQKRAADLESEFNDRPVPALDLAIYWVEYILNHGGHSLRSPAADLTLIQYYLLDVMACVIGIALAIIYIVNKCFSKIANTRNVKKIKHQ